MLTDRNVFNLIYKSVL